MSENTLAATLTGHNDWIFTLALYVRNGVPMLASGSDDGTIQLWDLSTNENIKSLSGHGHREGIRSLAMYETNDKTILISGSLDGTIKLWDLDTYTTINTLYGHQNIVWTHFDIQMATESAKHQKRFDSQMTDLKSEFTIDPSNISNLMTEKLLQVSELTHRENLVKYNRFKVVPEKKTNKTKTTKFITVMISHIWQVVVAIRV